MYISNAEADCLIEQLNAVSCALTAAQRSSLRRTKEVDVDLFVKYTTSLIERNRDPRGQFWRDPARADAVAQKISASHARNREKRLYRLSWRSGDSWNANLPGVLEQTKWTEKQLTRRLAEGRGTTTVTLDAPHTGSYDVLTITRLPRSASLDVAISSLSGE